MIQWWLSFDETWSMVIHYSIKHTMLTIAILRSMALSWSTQAFRCRPLPQGWKSPLLPRPQTPSLYTPPTPCFFLKRNIGHSQHIKCKSRNITSRVAIMTKFHNLVKETKTILTNVTALQETNKLILLLLSFSSLSPPACLSSPIAKQLESVQREPRHTSDCCEAPCL